MVSELKTLKKTTFSSIRELSRRLLAEMETHYPKEDKETE